MKTLETPTKENVQKLAEEGYEQVCIWPGILVVNTKDDQLDKNISSAQDKIADFENWVKEEFGVRVKYLEEVKTLPDKDGSGKAIPNTGDRNDLFFVVHKKDIGKFAIPRLRAGIRWYEDVVSYNNHANLYPAEILEKYEVRW